MESTFAVFLLLCLVGLAITAVGLFNTKRSLLVSAVAMAVAVAALVGAGYAWTESQSLPWTTGYAGVVLASLVSAGRQFTRN